MSKWREDLIYYGGLLQVKVRFRSFALGPITDSTSGSSITLCRSCLSTLRQTPRRHASTVALPIEIAPIGPSPSGQAAPPLTASESRSLTYKIQASVLLSRPPLLTRDLTPFEKSYFLYQRRLNERLALPFTRYFYYQKGTPGDVEWKRKIKDRLTPARDIGRYSGYGDEAWNDEVLVGDRMSEPEEQIQALVSDAEDREARSIAGRGKRDDVVEKPRGRVTEADEKGDTRSLNRSLTRTLYLVVKEKRGLNSGEWMFPGCALEAKESLHTAAERIIVQTGGINMNTWVVGNMPVGHQVFNYPQSKVSKEQSIETRGEKTFYMKARMMAGQANLKDNKFDLEDFQWLVKEELQKAIHPRDFAAVKNILADR
ncbi:MAG: hypothetical protein Q9217_000542 [Psora testacea]